MTTPLGKLITRHQALNPYIRRLTEYTERSSPPLQQEFWEGLSQIKTRARSNEQEMLANAVWCLETIGKAQDEFLVAYKKNAEDEFYRGWCHLARCENKLRNVKRHFDQNKLDLGFEYLQVYTAKWQKLYPYTYFMSPSFVIAETKCSICGEVRSLRGGCDHVIGDLYWGEMCYRIITDIERIPEISLVEDPVQRYSVPFPKGRPYNYALVKNVVTGTRSPWSLWDVEKMSSAEYWQRFHGIGDDDPCPCGTGDEYAQCCQDDYREKPHLHIWYPPDAPARKDTFEAYKEYRVPHPEDVVRDRQEIAPEQAKITVEERHLEVEEASEHDAPPK